MMIKLYYVLLAYLQVSKTVCAILPGICWSCILHIADNRLNGKWQFLMWLSIGARIV